MITLTLKQPVDGVPLEAEVICPDVMTSLDTAAISALPVYLGKRERRLDDFFTVDGSASDDIHIHGDLRKVRWIGRGMTRGRIAISDAEKDQESAADLAGDFAIDSYLCTRDSLNVCTH